MNIKKIIFFSVLCCTFLFVGAANSGETTTMAVWHLFPEQGLVRAAAALRASEAVVRQDLEAGW